MSSRLPLAGSSHPEMNARSRELLDLARQYAREQDLTGVSGVLVAGSVAWGLASPVSDVDVFFVAPSIEGRVSDKVAYRGEFVDHVWLARSLFEDRTALLDDDFRAYLFSRVIVLDDLTRDGVRGLTEVCAWLEQQMSRVTQINRYVDRRLASGKQAEEAATLAAARREFANLARLIARAATEYGQALLHRVPAGHCGTWTNKLAGWARASGETWLLDAVETTLFPEGVPTSGLAALIDEVANLHRRSATPPRGPDVGCGPANADFFARKARHYLQTGDPVSCIVVLRRLAHYADSSVATKLAMKDNSGQRREAESLQAALASLNARLWAGSPTSPAGAERALAALASLRQRVARDLLVRVTDA